MFSASLDRDHRTFAQSLRASGEGNTPIGANNTNRFSMSYSITAAAAAAANAPMSSLIQGNYNFAHLQNNSSISSVSSSDVNLSTNIGRISQQTRNDQERIIDLKVKYEKSLDAKKNRSSSPSVASNRGAPIAKPYSKQFNHRINLINAKRREYEERLKRDPIESRSYGGSFYIPGADQSRAHSSDRTFGQVRPLSRGRSRDGDSVDSRDSRDRGRSRSRSNSRDRSSYGQVLRRDDGSVGSGSLYSLDRGRSLDRDSSRGRSRSRSNSQGNSIDSSRSFSRDLRISRDRAAAARQAEALKDLKQQQYVNALKGSGSKPWIPSGNGAKHTPGQSPHKSVTKDVSKKFVVDKAWRKTAWPGLLPSDAPNIENPSRDRPWTRSSASSLTRDKPTAAEVKSGNNTHVQENSPNNPSLHRKIVLGKQSSHLALTTRIISVSPASTDPGKESYGILILRKGCTKAELIEEIERQFDVFDQISDVAIATKQAYSGQVQVFSLSKHTIGDEPAIDEDSDINVYLGGISACDNEKQDGVPSGNDFFSQPLRDFRAVSSVSDLAQASSDAKKKALGLLDRDDMLFYDSISNDIQAFDNYASTRSGDNVVKSVPRGERLTVAVASDKRPPLGVNSSSGGGEESRKMGSNVKGRNSINNNSSSGSVLGSEGSHRGRQDSPYSLSPSPLAGSQSIAGLRTALDYQDFDGEIPQRKVTHKHQQLSPAQRTSPSNHPYTTDTEPDTDTDTDRERRAADKKKQTQPEFDEEAISSITIIIQENETDRPSTTSPLPYMFEGSEADHNFDNPLLRGDLDEERAKEQNDPLHVDWSKSPSKQKKPAWKANFRAASPTPITEAMRAAEEKYIKRMNFRREQVPKTVFDYQKEAEEEARALEAKRQAEIEEENRKKAEIAAALAAAKLAEETKQREAAAAENAKRSVRFETRKVQEYFLDLKSLISQGPDIIS